MKNINFSNVISLIALAISVINLIIYFIHYNKKLEININTYRSSKRVNGYFYIYNIQIINKSKIPISIKGINCNGSECPLIPYRVKEETEKIGDKILEHKVINTFQFPINLSSLEGRSGYVEFNNVNELNLNEIYFKVYTNRGTIKKIKPNFQKIKRDDNYKPFDNE